MSLAKRVYKLETKQGKAFAIIELKPGESKEQALRRCFPIDPPKTVLFLDESDMRA